MPMTKAPKGLAITTALATVYQNAANSALRETVRLYIVNKDGTNDVMLTAFNFVDASPSGTYALLPVNTKVAAGDMLSVTKVLEPGDLIQASASAVGDMDIIPEVIFTEPV